MAGEVTAPGWLREPGLGDLVTLAPGGAPATLGVPPHCDFRRGHMPVAGTTAVEDGIQVSPQIVLEQGHRWFMTTAQVLSQLVGDQLGGSDSLVSALVARASAEVQKLAQDLFGFIPLVYEAGPALAAAPAPTAPGGVAMPNPDHVRITYSGVFGTSAAPVEEWSFSLKTTPPPVQDQAALDAAAAAAGDAFTGTLGATFTDTLTLTRVTYARVAGATGHWAKFPDGSFQAGHDLRQFSGRNGSGRMPPQVALVVSLGTGRAGATGKGRFYLPWQSNDLGTDWRIPESEAAQFASRAASFVSQLNKLGGTVSVMSSKGYGSPVTSVRIGRVLDTQRLRRNGLDEGYVGQPVAA